MAQTLETFHRVVQPSPSSKIIARLESFICSPLVVNISQEVVKISQQVVKISLTSGENCQQVTCEGRGRIPCKVITLRSSQSIQVKADNLAFFGTGGSKGAALDSSPPHCDMPASYPCIIYNECLFQIERSGWP